MIISGNHGTIFKILNNVIKRCVFTKCIKGIAFIRECNKENTKCP